jgi:hypothetical protein
VGERTIQWLTPFLRVIFGSVVVGLLDLYKSVSICASLIKLSRVNLTQILVTFYYLVIVVSLKTADSQLRIFKFKLPSIGLSAFLGVNELDARKRSVQQSNVTRHSVTDTPMLGPRKIFSAFRCA